jgi:phosphate-selective porin OprO and OprP
VDFKQGNANYELRELIINFSMKKFYFLLLLFAGSKAYSQSPDDVLNLLVSNKSITREQADSLKADAALKEKEAEATKKSFWVTVARQMQLTGFTQLRYQVLDEAGKNNGFDLRRARLYLKGNITPKFAYHLQAEFADKPKIMDGFAEIKIADFFMITAGQFRIPFSLENLTATSKLDLIERSQAVEAMVGYGKDVTGNQYGRDIGIMAGGIIVKSNDRSILEYRLGLFNGTGVNVADTANEAKDVVARLVISPIKRLSIGISGYNGWDKAIIPDVPGKSQVRNRLGMDVSYVADRVSLKGEFIRGKDGITDKQGWYLQAGYFIIPQRLQVLAKYDTYDPSMSQTDNISTFYVIGANFNFNTWSRLQAYYTFRQEEGPAVNNNVFAMQFQIGF